MRLASSLLVILPLVAYAGDSSLTVQFCGRAQGLIRLRNDMERADTAVVFLPGDGGWRGAAVAMARTISSWGYDVYGFDTKRYLESCTEGGSSLSQQQLATDMRSLAAHISVFSHLPVAFVGWSQGAGMAVAAASGKQPVTKLRGVLTLGLPQSAVLGWDWKATLAALARREPDQPAFSLKPLLPGLAPTPVWMIYGSEDEFTKPDTARALYQAASEPKRIEEVAGANHRFEGHQDELYRSIRKGLAWLVSPQ